MHIDPRDPAGQAFVADYLNDYPMADFDEAAEQSDALQCGVCKRWFTSRHDFDLDLLDVYGERVCEDCDAEGPCEHESTLHARGGSVVG